MCAGEVNCFRYYKRLEPIAKLATSYAYAVQVRYPGEEPTLAEAREALQIAQAVRRWARPMLLSSSRQP
jgi:hypothetical protein